MELDKSFFEAEVRDGFYVTSEMKQAWAAQLEVLSDVDRACRENGIQYFAEWGTLLGAVRHHGFIPWDDDMDICMKRPDYDRFLQIAEQVMPEGYKIFNINSDENNDNMLTRIINGRTINFEKAHLEKYHGFPYVSGIDIFPLDFIAPDKEDDDFQCEIISIVNSVAKFVRELEETQAELSEENINELAVRISQIEELCGVTIDREKNLVQQLNVLVDRLCGLYREDEAEYITIMTLWAEHRQYKFPKEYYAKAVRLPFENITIPVPYSYDAILKKKYGDYMKLVHTWDSHDYPFFDKQKKVLIEKGASFNEFRESFQEYSTFRDKLQILRTTRNKLKSSVTDCGNAKRTIVFMPFKAKHWDMMDGLWREYSKDPYNDVIVMPIPYYYKSYDGTTKLYESDIMYPEYLNIVTLDEYNYELENPDEIIIQNPYDGYNIAGSVHPRFYTKNLAIHTDRLTYIPYFVTEEINPQDMRAYDGMKDYVTMPGVVYADRVIVQSEGTKQLYVNKLMEFYGKETDREWLDKIQGNGSEYIQNSNSLLKYNRMPSEWKTAVMRADGSFKKIILYYISTNGVLEHRDKMFEKIGRSMEVFVEYSEDIMPLLVFDVNMEEVLEQEDVSLLMEYNMTLRKYQEYVIQYDCVKMAVDACDAFYGEAGAEAQWCRNAGKPVMIQDVDI